MENSVIEVLVDEETARAYREAGPTDRARFAARLALLARHGSDRDAANERLTRLMDDVGRRADAIGLTDEGLADLLTEPDANDP